jgi:hypothetical protein
MGVPTDWQEPPGGGGLQLLDAVQIPRTGSPLMGIIAGTFTLDVASIGASQEAEQTQTITGVAVGDLVIVVGPDAGLSVAVAITAAYVSATDTVKFRIVNPTAGALDPASAVFRYYWFDFT